MTKLSKRLERIIEFVDNGSKTADIGCDHGFVTIELLRRGIVERAAAADVNREPLKKAKENAEKAGVSDRISFYLSDGLKKLPTEGIDTVIIAGMGGILMTRILDEAPDELMSCLKTFILAPQSEYEHFRHFLADKGYEIIDEALIEEDGKYYPIIKCNYSGRPYSFEKEIYYRYGKILPERRDNTLRDNLLNDLEIYAKILDNNTLPEMRRNELLEKTGMIRQIIDQWP